MTAWDVNGGTGGPSTVVSIVNGDKQNHEFEGSTLLSEAIKTVASKLGLGSVIVRADGRDVQQSEGSQPISEFNSIELTPKMAGAV